jgi:DNA-binding beta-propeller fold protein YncE
MTELIRVLGTSGREGKGEGQFAQPRGICINHLTKELFVVDCNNHRIQVFHLLSLSFIRQIGKGIQGSGPGLLMYPVGICMASAVSSSPFAHHIYVADTNNHRIVVFNHITGAYVRSIGSQGTGLGCLNCPYGVYCDGYEGLLYVADYENNRIQVFDIETGNFIRMYGGSKSGGPGNGKNQFNQPIDVTIDHEFNYLIVADYSNNRVQILDKTTGDYVRSLGNNGANSPDSLNGPRSLCINQEANLLLVSDRENHRIQLFNKTTHMLLRHVGLGMGLNIGQFNRPMELCIDNEEGVLIVVDGYNHRVQIIELPELQQEKQRIKSLKERKLQILSFPSSPSLLAKFVKPSLFAVSHHTFGSFPHVKVVDSQCFDTITMEFPRLGSTYLLTLSKNEYSSLVNAFPSLLADSQKDSRHLSFDLVETHVDAFSAKGQMKESLLEQQAQAFLAVLKVMNSAFMADENSISVLFMSASPSILALYSLRLRGWIPRNFPVEITLLIIKVVGNIELSSSTYPEANNILDASVGLLKAILHYNCNNISIAHQREIFSAAVSSLKSLSTEPCDMMEFFGVSKPAPGGVNDLNHDTNSNLQRSKLTSHGVIAIFNIILDALRVWTPVNEEQGAADHPTTSLLSFHVLNDFKSSKNNHRSGYDRSVHFSLSDLVRLMYGVDGASLLTTVRSEGFDPSRQSRCELLTLSGSFISCLGSYLQMLYLDPGELSRCVPSDSSLVDEEMFISKRISFFQSFCSHFQEIALISSEREPIHGKRKTLRGGRNIWDGVSSVVAGDLLDCMDKEKTWFESIVIDVSAVDGSLRIHFMGWGSKWDDTVSPSEFSVRTAVLNTHTKDWRAELFEGGLIEIKCNDDLVNQKWMWGKIAKIVFEQAWLEVAYSFSNEPVVVKKAWLYGETICPVGMHTKDKSKAAAALVSRPDKLVIPVVSFVFFVSFHYRCPRC